MVQIVYLALVLGTAGWTAWRAVRDRGTPERFRGPAFRALAVALAACGSGLMVHRYPEGRRARSRLRGDRNCLRRRDAGRAWAPAGAGLVAELAPQRRVAVICGDARFVHRAAGDATSRPGLAARRCTRPSGRLGTIAFAYGLRQLARAPLRISRRRRPRRMAGARRSPPCGAPFIVTLARAILRIAPVDLRWRPPLVQKAGIHFSGTPSKSGYAGYAHPGVFIRQYCSR